MREAVGQDRAVSLGGRVPFGIDVAMGAVVMVTAMMTAAVLFPAAVDVPARLVVVCLAVCGCVVKLADTRASLVTVGLGYLLFTGFLANRYGEVTWDGAASMWRLAAFAVAVGLGLGRRWIQHVRAGMALADEFDRLVEDLDTSKKESHGG